MKQLAILFSLALVLLTAGCNMTDQADINTGYVRCLIDGQSWESDELSSALYDEVLGNFSVHGANEDSQTSLVLDIVMMPAAVGTYALDDYDGDASFRDHIQLMHFSTTENYFGSITITSLTDSRVKGTFTFDAESVENQGEIIEVRNGEFDVEFY